MDRNLFSDDAARRIADAVRRVEAMVKGLEGGGRGRYAGDNEHTIDAVAMNDCAQWSLGECVPNLPPLTYPTHYWNTLGDITTGQDIVIEYSHRSGQDSTRNSDANTPTPWIVTAASCNDPNAMQFNNPGNSEYLMVI